MNFIEIGKIVNTHGLKGHLKVEPWCDGIEVFEYLNKVYIKSCEYVIESVKPHKGVFLLKLKLIDDINIAEKLKGSVIFADGEDMPPLDDGVYYIKDILGLKVYNNGVYIGEIYDWIETGSKNVYVVKRDGNSDVLFPAVDEMIEKIDTENKIMYVNLPEGLI